METLRELWRKCPRDNRKNRRRHSRWADHEVAFCRDRKPKNIVEGFDSRSERAVSWPLLRGPCSKDPTSLGSLVVPFLT